jgi:ATP/maltotriose-dependent transcriptional regulator MalT
MTDDAIYDEAAGHRFFSAHAFNRAWDYIRTPWRTADETEAMLHAAHASFWHWLQRPDQTRTNLCIGYWQLARVYTLAGDIETALRYARRCLESSAGTEPVYEGFAHEALARAEAARGDMEAAAAHRARGLALTQQVEDPEDRLLLENDLNTIA